MARRKIKRRRGEGIAISGPATVRVTRGVTLVVEAARNAQVARLKKLTGGVAVTRTCDLDEENHERHETHEIKNDERTDKKEH
jgi:hypothetical protein